MTTRFIFVALQLFGVAAVVATAVALLAPFDAIRFLGVVALLFAGTGLLVQLSALQRYDPRSYRRLRFRFRVALKGVRAIGARGAALVTAAIEHLSTPRSAR
jgi:hypothetical protein